MFPVNDATHRSFSVLNDPGINTSIYIPSMNVSLSVSTFISWQTEARLLRASTMKGASRSGLPPNAFIWD